MMEPEKKRSDFEEVLAVIIMVISCFFVFTYFLTAVLGPVLFFSTTDGIAASVKLLSHGILVWLFVVIFFYIPVIPNVGEVFLFLSVVFFLCLLAAWKFRKSFHNVIRKRSSSPIGEMFSNFLVAMPIITSMLFIAVLAIISTQTSVGAPTTPPPGMEELPPFIRLFEGSYAVLIEEIGFRITPIGLYLIVRVFKARARNGMRLSKMEGGVKLFFTALLLPDQAKKTVDLKSVSDFGIRGGINREEWIMIILTSFSWGVAHFLVGGWTIAKATSVFVDGLVFGLAYLAYGLYAPILLHWFFNYYLSILDPGFSLQYFPYLTPISVIAVLLILVVGIGGWIVFAIIGVKKLLRLKAKPSSMPPPLEETKTYSTAENDTT